MSRHHSEPSAGGALCVRPADLRETNASVSRKARASRLLWLLSALLFLVSMCFWLVFLAGLRLGFDKKTFVVLATAGALALEGAFWSGAAALGLKAFEARRRIWRWLTGRGRDGALAGKATGE